MEYHLDELTINISRQNITELRACWEWLIKDMGEVLMISKIGDMFLKGTDNAIYWLATDAGTLTQIAENAAEFELLLKDEENIDNWLLPSLIGELEDAGKWLKEDQVYSFKKMPVLGGNYTIENTEPTNIKMHFNLTGLIFDQIKALPNGTKVKIKIHP